jgi:hypothetical protein
MTGESLAQNKDSAATGTIRGIIKDSAYNYALQSASVAIYSKDTVLVSYQLSDISGNYSFEKLPLGVALILRVYYTGYGTSTVRFSFSSADSNSIRKNILLRRNENELAEVIVTTVAPVRMNGDTLEFNSAAFHLDKNAVGEDLLRKLPGVTVWADGSITVNGKQVNKVLVDGRPFFGNDARIATQNIGKNAIDKIQVYDVPNSVNPLDSLTNINIKLKKADGFRYFGKTGIGGGTDSRYGLDGSINLFKPQTQIGFLATGNNINKLAPDVNTLLKNSTYKGVNAAVDYQTDFNLQGTNRVRSAGIVFQHDFLAALYPEKKELLTGNYFFGNTVNNTIKDTRTITSLPNNDQQRLNASSSSYSLSHVHRINANYNRLRLNSQFDIGLNVETIAYKTSSTDQFNLLDRLDNTQSINASAYNSDGNTKKLSLELHYIKKKNPFSVTRTPGDFEISYHINHTDTTYARGVLSDFTSVIDPAQNKLFNRMYHRSARNTKQELQASVGDLSRWLFGYKNRLLARVDIKLQNYIEYETHSDGNSVSDYDTGTKIYLPNNGLTADNRFTVINEMPGLRFSKTITRAFDARYQKKWLFSLLLQEQFYNLHNKSTQLFQNISYGYSKFTPVAEFSYANFQYGEFSDNYNAKFLITADYPIIDQLVPLTDSINLYFIKGGNIKLRPTDRKEFVFNWRHSSSRVKGTFNYNAELRAGIVNNSFADSSIIDSLGRMYIYTVNAGIRKYFSLSGSISRAFKINKYNQLQFTVSPMARFDRIPNSINSISNVSNSFTFQNVMNIQYAFRDLMVAELKQSLFSYTAWQQNSNNGSFRNQMLETSMSISLNANRKLNFGSNINFRQIKSTARPSNTFTIWNANAAYRLLPDNSFEIRLEALDLLHQNTGVYNYGDGYRISNGISNVLQQYFIVTISYFPRKFDK